MENADREITLQDTVADVSVKPGRKQKETNFKVSPARRFFARIYDMAIILAVVLPVCHFLKLLSWSISNYIVIQCIYTGTFFVYDFLMNTLAGGTCGKLLLGLGVAGEKKSHLGIGMSFVRSVIFIVTGVGLLIPPLTVVTTILCFISKRRGKKLLWEKKAPVYAHHITGLQVAWTSLLVIAVVFVGMIPSIISYIKIVPHYGDLTVQEFKEDYDAIEAKYIDSFKDINRAYDPSFYEANRLYNMEDFKLKTDENGVVKGFIYAENVPFGKEYETQRRDLVIIGISTLIASIRDNRSTYNIIMSNFSAVFEKPFDAHDITSGGVRVVHTSKKGLEGQLVIYEVSLIEEGNS